MINSINFEKKFIELDLSEIPENLGDFFLDTEYCESQLSKFNEGVDFSKPYLLLGLDSETLARINYHAPFFKPFIEYGRFRGMERVIEKLNRLYGEISSPCSMLLEEKGDLMKTISVGYQVSYASYLLFKRTYKCFPENRCGESSRSVLLSMMDFGYPNAAYAYNKDGDHGYVIMPFLIRYRNLKGTVIIDPTYDQIWSNEKKKKARNAVFIKLGEEWDYVEDRRGGKNLYPQRVLSFDTLARNPELVNRSADNYPVCNKSYFKDAFSNPLELLF